ncbi:MAG TPA: hypothetical protein VMT21_11590 [Gemmatimonadales bacterium]|nr:hypothetical protein [Gemmatimonadales bacterium]
MALPPRNHRIVLKDAAEYTRRHREHDPKGVKSYAFHKDQVLEMLGHPGCVGLRIHHARAADGKPTVLLTGIDAADNDLTGATMLQNPFPCPPICGGGNALNNG